eukprot:944732_1
MSRKMNELNAPLGLDKEWKIDMTQEDRNYQSTGSFLRVALPIIISSSVQLTISYLFIPNVMQWSGRLLCYVSNLANNPFRFTPHTVRRGEIERRCSIYYLPAGSNKTKHVEHARWFFSPLNSAYSYTTLFSAVS